MEGTRPYLINGTYYIFSDDPVRQNCRDEFAVELTRLAECRRDERAPIQRGCVGPVHAQAVHHASPAASPAVRADQPRRACGYPCWWCTSAGLRAGRDYPSRLVYSGIGWAFPGLTRTAGTFAFFAALRSRTDAVDSASLSCFLSHGMHSSPTVTSLVLIQRRSDGWPSPVVRHLWSKYMTSTDRYISLAGRVF
jgi:hypothetical protein